MSTNLEKIREKILKQISPDAERKRQIRSLAKKLRKKVEASAEKARIKAVVRVEGSVAKDTWLSREPDIDIFMQLPSNMPREEFEKNALKIAREATEGHKQVERFAEHPYLEAFVDGVRVNIVPCYKAKRGQWRSATDRTPFHTDYVKTLLTPRLRDEVRLLKQFMKGVGVYGAEIKVGGFSGYLCELLVLNYQSFTNVLNATANWKYGQAVDYGGFYKNKERELELLFKDPLVIIDPVDKGRNAASAVRKERLDWFIAASRAFLKSPSTRFFNPPKTKPYPPREIAEQMMNRDSSIVFVKFGRVNAVPDVLWGQLYKSQRALKNLLWQNDFRIIRDAVWSNESDLNMFIFELEQLQLPAVKKHLGPPLDRQKECENFLQKHLNSAETFSGPMLEDGRWIVETRRKVLEADELLEQKLKTDGGRQVGVAEEIAKAIRDNFEILTDDAILSLYRVNKAFAEFLTMYYEGRPNWLAKTISRKTKR
ncbi:MAG: CCA tRNA nucleotidyltransferase [Candidatus Bathyarchaeales archaeon]